MMITSIEPHKLGDIQSVSVSSTATDVSIGGRAFFLQNNTGGAVYFKEKNGAAATASNGMKIAAGEVGLPFIAGTISIVAAESGSVLVIFLK